MNTSIVKIPSAVTTGYYCTVVHKDTGAVLFCSTISGYGSSGRKHVTPERQATEFLASLEAAK